MDDGKKTYLFAREKENAMFLLDSNASGSIENYLQAMAGITGAGVFIFPEGKGETA